MPRFAPFFGANLGPSLTQLVTERIVPRMTSGLKRFHESGQSHFLTFSCHQRRPNFASPETCNLFVECLERMRIGFEMRIYPYVVMPEHAHLLVSEPIRQTQISRHSPHCQALRVRELGLIPVKRVEILRA